jgi:general stress protein CsbA
MEYSIRPPPLTHRQFWQSLVLLLAVLFAGWASRRYSIHLPLPIRKRTGDALWACAVFVFASILRPRWSTLKVAVVALAISYCVEFSQIYHRPWIDHIRSYTLGRLILGTTFFWLDQLAYTIGIAAIAPVDFLLICRQKTTFK